MSVGNVSYVNMKKKKSTLGRRVVRGRQCAKIRIIVPRFATLLQTNCGSDVLGSSRASFNQNPCKCRRRTLCHLLDHRCTLVCIISTVLHKKYTYIIASTAKKQLCSFDFQFLSWYFWHLGSLNFREQCSSKTGDNRVTLVFLLGGQEPLLNIWLFMIYRIIVVICWCSWNER